MKTDLTQRLEKLNIQERMKTIYGPETKSTTRDINMCMHWTASPNDKVDPAFVSLTAD